jgi:hypothetical protein
MVIAARRCMAHERHLRSEFYQLSGRFEAGGGSSNIAGYNYVEQSIRIYRI